MAKSKISFICIVVAVFVGINISMVNSAVYGWNDCHDQRMNKTYDSGEQWMTPSCHKCNCYTEEIDVAHCLEVIHSTSDDQAPSVAESTELITKKDSSDFADLLNRTEVVELVADRAENFSCPSFVPENEFVDVKLKAVNYITYKKYSTCFTMAYPTHYPQDCEKYLDEKNCSYTLIDKATGGPCLSGPIMWVGK